MKTKKIFCQATDNGNFYYKNHVSISRDFVDKMRRENGQIDFNRLWLGIVLVWACQHPLTIGWFNKKGPMKYRRMSITSLKRELQWFVDQGYIYPIPTGKSSGKKQIVCKELLLEESRKKHANDRMDNHSICFILNADLPIHSRIIHTIFLTRLYNKAGKTYRPLSRRGFCREYGINKRTFYKWVKTVNSGGFMTINWNEPFDRIHLVKDAVPFSVFGLSPENRRQEEPEEADQEISVIEPKGFKKEPTEAQIIPIQTGTDNSYPNGHPIPIQTGTNIPIQTGTTKGNIFKEEVFLEGNEKTKTGLFSEAEKRPDPDRSPEGITNDLNQDHKIDVRVNKHEMEQRKSKMMDLIPMIKDPFIKKQLMKQFNMKVHVPKDVSPVSSLEQK